MKKLIFLLLCTISLPSLAERWYDVEVIVFKRNQNPETVKENWPESPDKINLSNAIPIFDSATLSRKGIQLLPKSDWKLNAEYNRLANHAGFKPLIHVAWRQNDGSKNMMPKLRFTAGQNYSDEFYTDGTPKGTSFSGNDFSANNTQKQSNPMYELDGFIRVYVQHYLFIETNLILREPGERIILDDVNSAPYPTWDQPETFVQDIASEDTIPTNLSSGNIEPDGNLESSDTTFTGFETLQPSYIVQKYLNSYAFDQKRRMRSGEIHYLDHPLVGLIIQVTKSK